MPPVVQFQSLSQNTFADSPRLLGHALARRILIRSQDLDAVETAWDHPIRADLDSPPCNLVQRLPRLMEPENQSSPAKSS